MNFTVWCIIMVILCGVMWCLRTIMESDVGFVFSMIFVLGLVWAFAAVMM